MSFKTYLPTLEGSEDIPVITTARNKFERGAPAFLKSSVTGLLCTPDLTVGTVVTESGNLRAVGSVDGKGQIATFNPPCGQNFEH